MQGTFKSETSFEKRCELCSRIRAQYTDRVPVIVEVANTSQLKLNRKKFLAPSEISVGAFLGEIRKQTNVKSDQAIFIFCGNGGTVLVPTSNTMDEIYSKYREEDGFLYITVALENTFGTVATIQMIAGNVFDSVLKSSSRVARTLGLNKWF